MIRSQVVPPKSSRAHFRTSRQFPYRMLWRRKGSIPSACLNPRAVASLRKFPSPQPTSKIRESRLGLAAANARNCWFGLTLSSTLVKTGESARYARFLNVLKRRLGENKDDWSSRVKLKL